MGDALADEVQRVLGENNITVDVVIPVSVFLDGSCPRPGLTYCI